MDFVRVDSLRAFITVNNKGFSLIKLLITFDFLL